MRTTTWMILGIWLLAAVGCGRPPGMPSTSGSLEAGEWGETASAERAQTEFRSVHTVAEKALPNFLHAAHTQVADTIPEDTWAKAHLGEPFWIVSLRLDELRRENLDPAKKRLTDPRQAKKVVYPVVLAGHVRGGLMLYNTEGEWRAGAFDDPRAITPAYEMRKKLRDQAPSAYIVAVPAMSLRFLAFNERDRLLISPLTTSKTYSFKEGDRLIPDLVLERLHSIAKELGEYPPPPKPASMQRKQ